MFQLVVNFVASSSVHPLLKTSVIDDFDYVVV